MCVLFSGIRWQLRSQSIQISATYLAIPQFFMPLGAGMLSLQFSVELLRSILILREDTSGVLVLEESAKQAASEEESRGYCNRFTCAGGHAG